MMKNYGNEANVIKDNIDNFTRYASWIRWFPDLFIDSITPDHGTIRLDADQRILMRAIARFISVYGVFPRGWSKCVVGSTKVFTDQGLISIGDFFDGKKDGVEDYKYLDIQVKNKDGHYSKATKGVYNGYKNTIKVKTVDGFQLEGTYNHPIVVMDTTGKVGFKNLSDVTESDYVAINTKNNAFPKEMARFRGTVVHSDMLLAVAYFLSFAKYDIKRQTFYIEKEKPKFSEDFAIIKRMLKTKYSVTMKYDKNSGRWWLNNKIFDEIFTFPEECGDKCKAIPKFMYTCNRSQLVLFIKCYQKYSVKLKPTGLDIFVEFENIAQALQLLLLNLGIFTRTSLTVDGWKILIAGRDFKKYEKIIGFVHHEELAERFASRRKSVDPKVGTYMPYQKDLLRAFYKQVVPNSYAYYNSFKHYFERNSDVPKAKIKTLLNLSKNVMTPERVHFEKLYKTDYVFSKVFSLEKSRGHVYDIQVPETSSFVGNGFVNHNTFIEVLTGYVTCIAYPNMELAMTAQTKENASKLLWDKHQEIMRFYPFFENEISRTGNSKDLTEIYFKNGSKMDTLANAQSTKGSRRRRLVIEESALLNGELFDDVLKPVVNIGRITSGRKSLVDPRELNGSIDFFTTSGFKNSSEYDRVINLKRDMLNLKGAFCIGADYELALNFGRGLSRSEIERDRANMSFVAFAQNYLSIWVGVKTGALIDIGKFNDLRTLKKPHNIPKKGSEYVIGVDVARSEKDSNNQTSIIILELKRKANGKLSKINLVNLFNLPNGLNYSEQGLHVKRVTNLFAKDGILKALVIDGNIIGKGLIDELCRETFDPETGDSLGCYATMNTDQVSEIEDALDIIYDLKAQSTKGDEHLAFINAVESGILQLLERKEGLKTVNILNEVELVSDILPFANTDLLVNEVSNLKMKETELKGQMKVEQQIKSVDKDRYSALAYALWYCFKFEDEKIEEEDAGDVASYILMGRGAK